MSRTSSVNYQEVAAAAEALLTHGKKPSITAVKAFLEERGSPAVIGQNLKDWRNQALSSNAMATQDLLTQAGIVTEPSTPTAPVRVSQPVQVLSVQEVSVPEIQVPAPSVEAAPRSQHSHNQHNPHNQGQQNQQNQQNTGQQKNNNRFGRNRQNSNQHQNQGQHQSRGPREPREVRDDGEFDRVPDRGDLVEQAASAFGDYYHVSNLDGMDERMLRIQIHTLETCLNKEQSRRDAAEKMARQATEYSEVIKTQIAQRINDLRQLMDEQIQRLHSEITLVRQQAEQDLVYYREQLNKANHKILQLHQVNPAASGYIDRE